MFERKLSIGMHLVTHRLHNYGIYVSCMKYTVYVFFLVLYFIPRPPKHKATTQKLAKDRGKGRSNKNDIRYNMLTNNRVTIFSLPKRKTPF